MTTTPLNPPPGPDPSASQPRLLTCRRPEDVLAAVPVVLGFDPDESVVMLTLGAGESFQARIDLPPRDDAECLEEVLDLLRDPALAHDVAAVMFVVYAADTRWARAVVRRLEHGFEVAGVAVFPALVVSGGRWFEADDLADPKAPGTPFDCGSHRFRAEAVLSGQVISASREDLAARLRPGAGVRAVERSLRRAVPLSPGAVEEAVAACLASGTFGDDVLAGVLLGLLEPAGRDRAWGLMTSASASAHLALWTDAVQRTPRELVAAPAAVLALAAWLTGHGALAWCGVDLATEHDPGSTLARLVRQLLTQAVPPSRWDEESVGGLSGDRAAG